jgi:predicted flap endonuclease-1-like 5' DNA nuclease
MVMRLNDDIAGRLDEVARLLAAQGADPWRVRAYRRAAASVRRAPTPIDELFASGGMDALKRLPGVGDSIARGLREMVTHGRFPMLDRIRGDVDATAVLASVPGIGAALATRLHDDLGIETLADLEAAAHDGRLETVAGFGEKRLAGIRDSLAHRLGRVRRPASGPPAPVSELLDVDREYREKVAAGALPRIAPRRFNPGSEAWLPVLHTKRGVRSYTALYSNTARAHAAGKTRDWVVLYHDDGSHERQHTVITATRGPLRNRRVVAGREAECDLFYRRCAA